MTKTSALSFRCPQCGTGSQRFTLWISLRRVAKTTCTGCGQEIRSNVPEWKYTLLLIYDQIVILALATPIVISISGSKILVGAATLIALIILIGPPYLYVHARSVRLFDCDHRSDRSGIKYGRKTD